MQLDAKCCSDPVHLNRANAFSIAFIREDVLVVHDRFGFSAMQCARGMYGDQVVVDHSSVTSVRAQSSRIASISRQKTFEDGACPVWISRGG